MFAIHSVLAYINHDDHTQQSKSICSPFGLKQLLTCRRFMNAPSRSRFMTRWQTELRYKLKEKPGRFFYSWGKDQTWDGWWENSHTDIYTNFKGLKVKVFSSLPGWVKSYFVHIKTFRIYSRNKWTMVYSANRSVGTFYGMFNILTKLEITLYFYFLKTVKSRTFLFAFLMKPCTCNVFTLPNL